MVQLCPDVVTCARDDSRRNGMILLVFNGPSHEGQPCGDLQILREPEARG